MLLHHLDKRMPTIWLGRHLNWRGEITAPP